MGRHFAGESSIPAPAAMEGCASLGSPRDPATGRQGLTKPRQSGPPPTVLNPVRYTLLAPPSRLTPYENAALLSHPRRVLRADLAWFAPDFGEMVGQSPFELRG